VEDYSRIYGLIDMDKVIQDGWQAMYQVPGNRRDGMDVGDLGFAGLIAKKH